MTYKEKSKILTRYFNIYGYGNFDLSLEELSAILEVLERSENLEKEIKEIYDRLYQTRMG